MRERENMGSGMGFGSAVGFGLVLELGEFAVTSD